MFKVTSMLLLLCIALACAEPRVQKHRGLDSGNGLASTNHPYLFLSVPRGRSGAVLQGFAVVEEDDGEDALADDTDDDDDDDHMADDDQDEDVMAKKPPALEDNDDDGDVEDEAQTEDDKDEEEEEVSVVQRPMQQMLQQSRPTQMMVSREHAGAIMVPDGFIELEAQAVTDEKTGKTAFLVPREALEAIPDGSVVALIERSTDASEMARANRVMVRRRRKGVHRNVNRGGSGNQRLHRLPNGYYWVMRQPAVYNNGVVREHVVNNNGVVRRRVVYNNNGFVRRPVNNNIHNNVRYIRINGNRRRATQD